MRLGPDLAYAPKNKKRAEFLLNSSPVALLKDKFLAVLVKSLRENPNWCKNAGEFTLLWQRLPMQN